MVPAKPHRTLHHPADGWPPPSRPNPRLAGYALLAILGLVVVSVLVALAR